MIRKLYCALIAAILLWGCYGDVSAQVPYSFQKVDVGVAKSNVLSINNQGQVALMHNGSGAWTIYRWDQGNLTPLAAAGDAADNGYVLESILSVMDLNDNGAVAFRARRPGTSSTQYLYTADGNIITYLTSMGSNVAWPTFNNSGQVAWSTSSEIYTSQSGQADILHARQGTSQEFWSFNPGSGGIHSAATPNINNHGTVVFRGILNTNNVDGIYGGVPGNRITIADESDGFWKFGNIVTINDSGQVVFWANTFGVGWGLYLGDTTGIAPTLILQDSVYGNVESSSINDNGEIVFTARPNGIDAIYHFANGVFTRLMQEGETFDGGIITRCTTYTSSLNNAGQILCNVELDDSGDGIFDRSAGYVASPVHIATPTNLTLQKGTFDSGGLAEVQASDDQYAVLDPRFLSFRYQLVFIVDGTSPIDDPTALEFKIESSTSNIVGYVERNIELFNFSTGQFESVDIRQTNPTDTLIAITPTGDPTRFVQPVTGSMQARISHQNGALFWVLSIFKLYLPYETSVDQIYWTIKP